MNFEGMSPQQAAEQIEKRYGNELEAIDQDLLRDVLAAIQHFSNRYLVAARRYEFMRENVPAGMSYWGDEWLYRAEKEFPDA